MELGAKLAVPPHMMDGAQTVLAIKHDNARTYTVLLWDENEPSYPWVIGLWHDSWKSVSNTCYYNDLANALAGFGRRASNHANTKNSALFAGLSWVGAVKSVLTEEKIEQNLNPEAGPNCPRGDC